MASRVLFNSVKHIRCSSLTRPEGLVRQYAGSSTPSWVPEDPKTHTGQKYEEGDYRLARFVDRKKHVNTQFAIDLIASVPPEEKKERVVSCDGGGGPTGHPKVYINLDKPGNHSCGYCGLRFYKDDHHH